MMNNTNALNNEELEMVTGGSLKDAFEQIKQHFYDSKPIVASESDVWKKLLEDWKNDAHKHIKAN